MTSVQSAPRTSALELQALGDTIAETAAHIDAATHRLLTAIRRFDELCGWQHEGALSMAHWLNFRIGLGLCAAREKVRVAHALAGLPRVDDGLRKGELSYSKTRAITRVATPATEAVLVEMAQNATASQLEKACRLYASVRDPQPKEAAMREQRRHVSFRATDDGMVQMVAVLHPDEAALVQKALAACDSAESAEPRAGERNGADDLVTLAETVLRGRAAERTPVDVTLHVSAETFEGHLEDGAGVSPEVSRRLTCDAGVAVVVEDRDGKVLDVGRKTRTIPTALRRALTVRDQGCRFPGCSNRRVDGHHVKHWSQGGETSLGNVLSLCRRHHGLVHEGGFTITEDGSEWVFRRPDGRRVGTWGRRPSAEDGLCALRERAARDGVPIDARTAHLRHPESRPDYPRIVDVLLARQARRGEPS